MSRKHQWRGMMGDVAEKCGTTVAIALMEKLGGAHFVVPKTYTNRGPMAKLGRELAEPFIAEYAGQVVDIPSKLATKRPPPESRFQEVEALIDKNYTAAQVAAELGISQAYVFKIRKAAGAPKISSKVDKRQKSLFD
ncbi:hypothetical protein [Epibacterium ulvae]|uniref:hypothetical protein n=1 Tax=Epibacterium ulvae TaxID=1156985 RepID=UPI0024913F13|nr:hypothetical protein [Epibacterium ulvae]